MTWLWDSWDEYVDAVHPAVCKSRDRKHLSGPGQGLPEVLKGDTRRHRARVPSRGAS